MRTKKSVVILEKTVFGRFLQKISLVITLQAICIYGLTL